MFSLFCAVMGGCFYFSVSLCVSVLSNGYIFSSKMDSRLCVCRYGWGGKITPFTQINNRVLWDRCRIYKVEVGFCLLLPYHTIPLVLNPSLMGNYWKSKAEKALCTLFVAFTQLQLTHTWTLNWYVSIPFTTFSICFWSFLWSFSVSSVSHFLNY